MRKSTLSKSFARTPYVFISLGMIMVGCSGSEIISTGPGGAGNAGVGGTVSVGGSASAAGSSSGGAAATGGAYATGGTTSVGNNATGGLGTSGTGGSPEQICTPGITQPCLGSAQCTGAQACNSTGMGWGVCDCGISGSGGSGGVSTGGANSTGGAVDSTGGAMGTGGGKAAGGTTANGGSKATGGAAATGGNKATGGAAATGGSKATGGVAATGGATGSCIATASGGPSAMNHGQACLGCHASGQSPTMTLAGTLYSTVTGGTAVTGATVTVTGSNGTKITMVTGSSGDFYSGSAITFPATVSISKCPDTVAMTSTIANGNCNNCHNSTMRIHLP